MARRHLPKGARLPAGHSRTRSGGSAESGAWVPEGPEQCPHRRGGMRKPELLLHTGIPGHRAGHADTQTRSTSDPPVGQAAAAAVCAALTRPGLFPGRRRAACEWQPGPSQCGAPSATSCQAVVYFPSSSFSEILLLICKGKARGGPAFLTSIASQHQLQRHLPAER